MYQEEHDFNKTLCQSFLRKHFLNFWGGTRNSQGRGKGKQSANKAQSWALYSVFTGELFWVLLLFSSTDTALSCSLCTSRRSCKISALTTSPGSVQDGVLVLAVRLKYSGTWNKPVIHHSWRCWGRRWIQGSLQLCLSQETFPAGGPGCHQAGDGWSWVSGRGWPWATSVAFCLRFSTPACLGGILMCPLSFNVSFIF